MTERPDHHGTIPAPVGLSLRGSLWYSLNMNTFDTSKGA